MDAKIIFRVAMELSKVIPPRLFEKTQIKSSNICGTWVFYITPPQGNSCLSGALMTPIIGTLNLEKLGYTLGVDTDGNIFFRVGKF